MMFELLVNHLCSSTWRVEVVNLEKYSASGPDRQVGGITILRTTEYVRLITLFLKRLVFGNVSLIYLVTGPTFAAFLRDAIFIWSSRILRVRIVCHQFGEYRGFFDRQSSLLKQLISYTLAQADRIIVEGTIVKEGFSFLPAAETQVTVIHNGLPQTNLRIPEKGKQLPAARPLQLLYLSNMIETKGYMDVLQAVNILVNTRRLPVFCQFAGKFIHTLDSSTFDNTDAARAAFFEYIRVHNLKNFVNYKEGLFGKEKADAFEKANIFLLPSNYIYEMQPVSVLEAMAYGTVVFGCAHRMIPEMVQDCVTGCIVAYGKPVEIADRIADLASRPDEYHRMSDASLKRYKQEYTPGKYVKRVEEVLENVLAQ
ncbi:MAG: glycosyltransferase family 4 protein [Pseudomonadota bacterium]